jgi:hypothetical protein
MSRVLTAFRSATLLLLISLGCAGAALAHKGSDAFLDVQDTGIAAPGAAPATPTAPQERNLRFELSVAIKDLDLLVPMDANSDGGVTWGEAKAATPEVVALVNQAANLVVGNATLKLPACHLNWQFQGLERRSDGAYLQLSSEARCPSAQTLGFVYTLFKTVDTNHRLLVAGQLSGKPFLSTASPTSATPLSLGEGRPSGDPNLAAASSGVPQQGGRMSVMVDYFSLGAHHLLEGYDHLAFLLALVLPLQLSLRMNRGNARPASESSQAGAPSQALAKPNKTNVWMSLLRTITAFTIGHSITLIMATLGWTTGSPQWVEPVIALSIGVTALLNLRPVPWLRTDVLALVFGMVHGYGFAGLLQEAAAPPGLLPYALTGFNLGVEAGQLLAVSGWVLLSQFVVNQTWYHSLVVRRGSQLLTLLAVWWFWQRVA